MAVHPLSLLVPLSLNPPLRHSSQTTAQLLIQIVPASMSRRRLSQGQVIRGELGM